MARKSSCATAPIQRLLFSCCPPYLSGCCHCSWGLDSPHPSISFHFLLLPQGVGWCSPRCRESQWHSSAVSGWGESGAQVMSTYTVCGSYSLGACGSHNCSLVRLAGHVVPSHEMLESIVLMIPVSKLYWPVVFVFFLAGSTNLLQLVLQILAMWSQDSFLVKL